MKVLTLYSTLPLPSHRSHPFVLLSSYPLFLSSLIEQNSVCQLAPLVGNLVSTLFSLVYIEAHLILFLLGLIFPYQAL